MPVRVYPKMTELQIKYVAHNLAGDNPIEAAATSGIAFPRVDYMYMEHLSPVQAVLGLARHKKEEKLAKLTKELEDILVEVPDGPLKWSDRIKAIELLAKLHDLFPDSKRPNVLNLNYFDVKDANPQQLALRLEEIKALQDQAIDAEVVQEEEEGLEEAKE